MSNEFKEKRKRIVTAERAKLAAQRLINSHFKNSGEHARMSIPVNVDDDDIVINDFIEQAESSTQQAPEPCHAQVNIRGQVGLCELLKGHEGIHCYEFKPAQQAETQNFNGTEPRRAVRERESGCVSKEYSRVPGPSLDTGGDISVRDDRRPSSSAEMPTVPSLSLPAQQAEAGDAGISETCKHCGYSIGKAKYGEFAGKYVHVLTGNVLCAIVAEPRMSPDSLAQHISEKVCSLLGQFTHNDVTDVIAAALLGESAAHDNLVADLKGVRDEYYRDYKMKLDELHISELNLSEALAELAVLKSSQQEVRN